MTCLRRHNIAMDNQIYKGSGTSGQLAGLFTNATDVDLSAGTIGSDADNLDRVYALLEQLEINNFQADVIVVSPQVYFSIVGLRTSTKELAIDPRVQIEDGLTRFLGVPVYRSTALSSW